MCIHSSVFNITQLNGQAYDLTIQFYSENNQLVSKKIFTFSQGNIGKGALWDVFTKNGLCRSSLLERLFQEKDEKAAESAGNLLNTSTHSDPTLLVLDLQDPNTQYATAETIAKCEAVVCQFLKSNSTHQTGLNYAQRIHAVFHKTLPIDFVLCEGSLKADLLQQGGFSEQEKVYLQKNKTGRIDFCQFAEFFMNAFKFGQSTVAFTAEKYIHPISNRFPAFQACQVSTVLYPSLYKDIYSPSGNFAKVLKAAFSVNGTFHQATGITTLTIARKYA